MSRLSCLQNALIASFVFLRLGSVDAQVTERQAQQIRAAVPEKATVAPKKPRRVLIWNTPYMEQSPHKGYTIPQGAYAMQVLGEKTGAFTGVISDDQTLLLPENLKQFDAIVMNNSCGPWTTPTDEALKRFADLGQGSDKEQIQAVLRKSFLEWLRGGHGMMAYHYSVGAIRHWPELAQVFGARGGGHPWNEEIGVKVEEPSHPLLAAFGGKDFRIAEETFQFLDPYDRAKLRVLLSVDTETTNMGVKNLSRKDNDYALAWVKPCGEGRVFYSEIGHRTEHWWNRTILRFYLDAIQFVCGDLEAPVQPR